MLIGLVRLPVRGFHPLWRAVPGASGRLASATAQSRNPERAGTRSVWALPRSLAATWGITFVFSSWGY